MSVHSKNLKVVFDSSFKLALTLSVGLFDL